jgi:hypothetical protein
VINTIWIFNPKNTAQNWRYISLYLMNIYNGLQFTCPQDLEIVMHPYSLRTGQGGSIDGQIRQLINPPVIVLNCLLFNFFPLLKI